MDQFKLSSLVIGLILCLVTPMLVFSQEKASNEKSEETLNIQVKIFKKPGCKCCERWGEHLEKHGFNITLTATDTLNEIKDQQDIPKNLRSCHTAFINDYVVEGHVPAESIKKC